MEENESLVKVEQDVSPKEPTYSVGTALDQVKVIQDVMSKVLKDGDHYYSLPGMKQKALGKSGAEKLNLVFRMSPDFETTVIDLDNGHREYRLKCNMTSIITGKFLGSGVGSCSTLESKFRYRYSERRCPTCGQKSIIKGKEQYGGGWVCYKKKGGCGEKFDDGDASIEQQLVGKIENPDIADQYNTCLKMAKKRAHVDAVLTCTAASDIFTQDLEENMSENKTDPTKKPQNPSKTTSKMGEIKRMVDEMNLTEKEKKIYRDMVKEKGETETFNAVSDAYATMFFEGEKDVK